MENYEITTNGLVTTVLMDEADAKAAGAKKVDGPKELRAAPDAGTAPEAKAAPAPQNKAAAKADTK